MQQNKWTTMVLPFTALVLGATATALGAVALLRGAGHQVDWGNVPGWISAIGSIATFAAIVIAALGYRQANARAAEERQDRLEDQAVQARQLVLIERRPVQELDENGLRRWYFRFVNNSAQPMRKVQIHSMRAHVEDDGPAVALQCVKETNLQVGGGGNLWAGDTSLAIELLPGEALETYWEASGSASCPPAVRAYQLSLEDANGRVWEVVDGLEPRKVVRPRRPENLMEPPPD